MALTKIKLTQLHITTEWSNEIISSSDEETITRHQTTLWAVINEVDNPRREIEAKKIEDKDVTEGNAKINKKLADTDSHVRTAKKWLEENRRKQESIERKEKLQFEMKLVESKLKLSNPTRDLIESGISGWNPSQTAETSYYEMRRFAYGLAKILGTVHREHREK